MASAEGGLVLSGVRYGERCPLPRRLGSGERCELPQRGLPAEHGFWRILKATERSFLYLTKSEGTIRISVPYSKFWGTCFRVPRDLRP